VNGRALFFKDISHFKFKRVGNIILHLDVAKSCRLGRVRPLLAADHLAIKRCADRYADSL